MIYDYHVVLGVIAASFGIAGYVIYIRSILRGFTRPHIFTWLIYVIVDGTIFAAQLAGGGGPGAFVVLTGAVANAAIVILAFQRGEKNITLSDWACFILALLAILLWWITNSPLSAVLTLTVANALAYIPTFRKSFVKPHEESVSIWALDVLRFGISIFALSALNLTTVLFPATVVLLNSLMASTILLRRRQLAIIPPIMNVTLIGMAGAGKSYIGKRLADRLGHTFLDIDSVLEEMHGEKVEKILEELGDEKFIETEEKAIISATSGKDRHVFSPGGSSIYEQDAMRHLGNISHIVFLKVPFSVIEKRIGHSPARLGRVVGLGDKSFEELYNERTALYEKYAHHSIESEKLTADETVQAIVDFLNKKR